MPSNGPPRNSLTHLRKLLVRHFTIEELRILCFDLEVEYEDLAGTTKTTKMQDLIMYLDRRGRLQELLNVAAEERPRVDWPNIDESQEKIAPLAETLDSYTDHKTGLVMIRIPEGEFLYGESKQPYYMPEFWISKTPGTNAHYQRFVSATNHDPPFHWIEGKPRAAIADHPVTYVSWHDAAAYAEWAGMMLPTEQEWEKAARGTDGRRYPWGNEWQAGRCNTWEAGIGGTTPVGKYSPGGDSPYGCVDMAGNVWEWTYSLFDDGEQFRRPSNIREWVSSVFDDDSKLRVVRSGSSGDGQQFARVTYRAGQNPGNRYSSYGFRLVFREKSGFK